MPMHLILLSCYDPPHRNFVLYPSDSLRLNWLSFLPYCSCNRNFLLYPWPHAQPIVLSLFLQLQLKFLPLLVMLCPHVAKCFPYHLFHGWHGINSTTIHFILWLFESVFNSQIVVGRCAQYPRISRQVKMSNHCNLLLWKDSDSHSHGNGMSNHCNLLF